MTGIKRAWKQRVAELPVRLCCMGRHQGVECPDGTVMCCMCFEKVPVANAWQDAAGVRWDICQSCGEHEARVKLLRAD